MSNAEPVPPPAAPPPWQGSPPDEPVDLWAYARVLYRHKKMILGVTVAASLAAAGIGLLLPTVYSATAKVLPRQQDQSLTTALLSQFGGLSMVAGGLLGSGSLVDTYAGMLETDTVRDAVIDRFDLMKVYDTKYRVDTYKELSDRADVSVGKKDGILSVTVEDRDPRRGADMANFFVSQLEKLAEEFSRSGTAENRAFLERKLTETKADLARSEEALKVFQKKNKTLDITEQVKASIQGIAQLEAELAAQEVTLHTLRRSFTDGSQEVRNAAAAVATLKGQIARLEGQQRLGAIPSVGSAPDIGQEQVRLLREFKVQEALSELLTKQYEVARLSEAQAVSPLQVLQKAKPADKKAKPQVSLIVAGTAVAALLLASAAAFVLEHLARAFGPGRRSSEPFSEAAVDPS